jgi:DNA polymerase elongation subunit (family B)
MKLPKILALDIETSPIIAHVWDIWEQNVGLNQIVKDWYILSFAAKWVGDSSKKIIYADQKNIKPMENDKALCKKVWKLLDDADIVLTQNGKKFDIKKLNARFVYHGFHPPSSYKQIDTCAIAKRVFGFTSNKLEYMAEKLKLKHRKLKHEKFSGHDLWMGCLERNKKAWKEMQVYNKNDVFCVEDLYEKIKAWDSSINFSVYNDEEEQVCVCGSNSFNKKGYAYTSTSKFQRYICKKCGHQTRGRTNLLTKEKRESLKVPTK